MNNNKESIQLITQIYNDLLNSQSNDNLYLEQLPDIVKLESDIPAKNPLMTYLTQKLSQDIDTHDYNEALYDIQSWLRIASVISQTNIDTAFLSTFSLIKTLSQSQLVETMKYHLNIFANNTAAYQQLLDYYKKYPLWGMIQPSDHQYELFQLRSASLKEHFYDFILLYSTLEDYRSKYCLVSILLNWLFFDCNNLNKAKETAFNDYFDLDILHFNENEVMVDIGAFKGDTLADYLNTYENPFKKYYCYEMNTESIKEIAGMIEKYDLDNVVLRGVAVGKENGHLYYNWNEDTSSLKLTTSGNVCVDVVSIDQDIKEPVTFIKMDIEGAEQDALLGCKMHIMKEHPKLAISVYHNNEDIWKIAKMIRGMDPSYRFYLRYNGGNLVPTETILFAV